jgi:hypothetical protein
MQILRKMDRSSTAAFYSHMGLWPLYEQFLRREGFAIRIYHDGAPYCFPLYPVLNYRGDGVYTNFPAPFVLGAVFWHPLAAILAVILIPFRGSRNSFAYLPPQDIMISPLAAPNFKNYFPARAD